MRKKGDDPMTLKSGDYVARLSYAKDIVFRVTQIYRDENGEAAAVLKGVAVRLIADAPLTDLERLSEEEARNISPEGEGEARLLAALARRDGEGLFRGGRTFDYPGLVLHLDGDGEYLKKCAAAYEKLGIPHVGLAVPEKDQPEAVGYYLARYRPEILVLTGHDSLIRDAKDRRDLDLYRASFHFAEAVRRARQYQPDRDGLVIFAGACQSCYEELIRAGANFASSPERVFIHIFDPVLVIERIAFTSIKEVLPAEEAVKASVTGAAGIGGVETRGCFRRGYPKIAEKVLRF